MHGIVQVSVSIFVVLRRPLLDVRVDLGALIPFVFATGFVLPLGMMDIAALARTVEIILPYLVECDIRIARIVLRYLENARVRAIARRSALAAFIVLTLAATLAFMWCVVAYCRLSTLLALRPFAVRRLI